ncbi:hypothetical protein BGZ63DRAFT_391752 [Mariannaea sp. PMI_226]|nr:hypothetical protein BGZ63DRAFT_391752 [Mariannaea sp. PMI_226]
MSGKKLVVRLVVMIQSQGKCHARLCHRLPYRLATVARVQNPESSIQGRLLHVGGIVARTPTDHAPPFFRIR